MEEEIKEHGSSYKNNFNYSPSSSPPTPPSPLPISVGPGNHNYSFSPSASPSPPFSLPSSAHPSAENLPFLLAHDQIPPSAFSLDGKLTVDQEADDHDKTASCLKDLLDWVLLRCCCCFSWPTQILGQRSIKIHKD
ncbi:hypothetical protein Ddye_013029 [Dipteronia dyeriana]|uniref:Uncharacterized protein n=1 Tax=Dipteronia dyeriana TaxID=168575 RepID=A0AAE0CJS9_9ROSI|nr:hypothetical protein Ddye_013029 [Dipteronia dyeriana]